jgi:2-keto-3-deoxygluconate permease
MLKNIQAIPAGLMLLPMLLASRINTFAPQLLQLGNSAAAIVSSPKTGPH